MKNMPANAGDMGLIPVLEDPLEKEWHPTLVFLPGTSHGAWRATVHRVPKSRT